MSDKEKDCDLADRVARDCCETLPNPDHEADKILAEIWGVSVEEAKKIADAEEKQIARSRPVNDNYKPGDRSRIREVNKDPDRW